MHQCGAARGWRPRRSPPSTPRPTPASTARRRPQRRPGGVARPVPRAPRPDRAVAQDRRHLSLLRRGAWSRRDLPQDGTHRRGLGPRPVLRAARRGRQVARGRRQGPHAPVGCAPPGGQVGDGLSALRWSGVDFDTAMLTVARSIVDTPGHVAEGPTKTHRVRIMALAPAAVALLRPQRRVADELAAEGAACIRPGQLRLLARLNRRVAVHPAQQAEQGLRGRGRRARHERRCPQSPSTGCATSSQRSWKRPGRWPSERSPATSATPTPASP